MKLEGKKQLAARALGVGRNRIIFNTSRLAELKEAITKQDFRDLKASGALAVKEPKGRKTIAKRKNRRRKGSIRKKVNKSKQEYVKLTRKLRNYLRHQKKTSKLSHEQVAELRKEIKTSEFRSLAHMKEQIKEAQ